MRRLLVHLLPSLVEPESLRGDTAVVIDVLRATTTIAAALAAGCREVVVCQEVAEAHERQGAFPPGTTLLGGERGGVKIAGFDLGNSPAEYTRERMQDKALLFTTTNGTRAMHRCRHAQRVLLGSFWQRQALLRTLRNATTGDLHFVCAGTDGQISREDVLLAGALCDGLLPASGECGNDAALLAVAAWRMAAVDDDRILLAAALRDSHGGRNLVELGMAADIRLAADLDKVDQVSIFDPATHRVCLGGQ